MRFVCRPIPPSRVLDAEEEGWTPLAEPSSQRFASIAMALAVPLNVPAVMVLLNIKSVLRAEPAMLLALASCLVAMVPLHEMLHAVAYPGWLRSRHLVVGIWPHRVFAYVVYDSPLPRNRVLLMILTPFVLLSVIPAFGLTLLSPAWGGVVLLVVPAGPLTA